MELNEKEIEFLTQKEWVDIKTKVFDQLYKKFTALGKEFQIRYSDNFPTSKNAKVSRGEYHQGYPYMVLDYPRIFELNNVLAFRLLFWWGNYISCTLHLKGEHLKQHSHKMSLLFDLLKKEKIKTYISIEGDEWDHDLESSSYCQLDDFNNSIDLDSFLKISFRLPLEEINNLDQFTKNCENILLKTLL